MARHDGELAPTARLRWVRRDQTHPNATGARGEVLQCWWAPAVPSYMVDAGVGEWKDVVVEQE